MKTENKCKVISCCLCLAAAGMLLPAIALAQTEPCSVEIVATCNGSTDCSGMLSGWTDIINTGTEAITCLTAEDFGSGAVGDEITLLPQEQKRLVSWIDQPVGDILFWDFRTITASGSSTATCYVTNDKALTCAAQNEWQCSATCDITPLTVDIAITAVSLKRKGVLRIILLGAEDFDVATVDPSSIRLGREDVRRMAAPLRWNMKHGDLMLKFDTADVVNTLQLETVLGQDVQLILTGRLNHECGHLPFMGRVVTSVVP